jgi:hypothetical protein
MRNLATGKVIAAVAVSLDGFIAGPDAGPEQALGLDGDRLFTGARCPGRWRREGKRPADST